LGRPEGVNELKPEPTLAAYEDVYRRLMKAIVGGDLSQDDRIVQLHWADQLNTSRTPIRRALTRLCQEGLVRQQGSEFVVVGLGSGDYAAIHHVQALLESHAAVLAAPRVSASDLVHLEEVLASTDKCIESGDYGSLEELNRAFHLGVYERCGQFFLLDLLRRLWRMYPLLCFGVSPGKIVRSQTDHYRILEAIIAQNPERIDQLIRAHILSTGWAPLTQR